MQLRLEAEKFFSEKGITPYLNRLHQLAMQKKSQRTALAAISEIIQVTLGKNFHLEIDPGEKLQGIIEIIAGFGKNGKGK